MTDDIDFLAALGSYWGEPRLRQLLSRLGIDKAPKRRPGTPRGFLENHALGIEVTFKLEDGLDVRLRHYPKRALVLSNIRFYGEPRGRFRAYAGRLPLGLAFGMPEGGAIEALGAPALINLVAGRTLRWDRPSYCVFADITPAGALSTTDLQLPVVSTP